jgi:hypothetical protein
LDRVTQAVKEAWDGGHYGRTFTVHQLIEQNPAYVPGKIGTIGMPWRSIKWQPSRPTRPSSSRSRASATSRSWRRGGKRCRRRLGHRARQEGAARHARAAACRQAVGRSRGHGGQAADLWGPPTIDRVSMLPGAHTAIAAVDMSVGIKPIYEIPFQVLSILDAKIERLHRAIDRDDLRRPVHGDHQHGAGSSRATSRSWSAATRSS